MAGRGGVRLVVAGKAVYAERVVFATNPFCLPLLGLQDWAGGVHTVAVATEPLPDAVFDAIGWATRTPFYTLDLPYLWGRATADGRAVIGAGPRGRDNVEHARADSPRSGTPVRGPGAPHSRSTPGAAQGAYHASLDGPLVRRANSKPIITSKDDTGRVLIATGYRGHGVALSVRVGKLLADVLAGEGSLPAWSYRPA